MSTKIQNFGHCKNHCIALFFKETHVYTITLTNHHNLTDRFLKMHNVTHNIAIAISIGFPVSAAVPACADATSRDCGRLSYTGVPGELCRHRQLSGGQ